MTRSAPYNMTTRDRQDFSMIVSASRRTDIPAFYAEWLMGRIRAGYCEVANPCNPAQVARVSLAPEEVAAFVFWTRDARPLLPQLAELDARGYRYYFQYTHTGYPRELEPGPPSTGKALETLARLAERVGPERVIWRYDPILFTTATPPAYHAEQFARLAQALRGVTRRAVVSIADDYRAATERMKRLAPAIRPREVSEEEFGGLMRALAATAAEHGLEIRSCAEEIDLRPYGIGPGKCIDDEYLRRVFGLDVTRAKDKYQRRACGCVQSKDIGAYDTCLHDCVYCYATRHQARARARHAAHRADAARL